MLIENIRSDIKDGLHRNVATITWEDSERSKRDVYFATTEKFSKDLVLNSDAFLVGCCLPAIYNGEKRIAIEGEVDQQLIIGLNRNMKIFRKWYGRRFRPVVIEANVLKSMQDSIQTRKAGLFLSGGVDSLYSLRMNRLNYSLDHPASIKIGILVHGFDIYSEENDDMKMRVFERAIERNSVIAKETGLDLIPIYTNIRHLEGDVRFWMKWFHGAALSSVALNFENLLNCVHIASSHSFANLEPWGSHPDIDLNYSSSNLSIVHDELIARLDKVRCLCNWKTALDHMRVCVNHHDEFLNCGVCETCIKTKIMLMALGFIDTADAFPVKEVSPEDLDKILERQTERDFQVNYYPLIKLLRQRGENALAEVILSHTTKKKKIHRWDKEYLHGAVSNLYSRLFLFNWHQ